MFQVLNAEKATSHQSGKSKLKAWFNTTQVFRMSVSQLLIQSLRGIGSFRKKFKKKYGKYADAFQKRT